ncbi:MAG: RNA polymerase sigma factor [Chitinophagaceae bacterium]
MQSGNEHSEQELLLRMAEGDADAFRAMYDMYYTRLCFFAASYTGDLAEAEDLVQELFIRLWRKRTDLPQVSHVKTYLYTSARNAAFDFLKSKKRQHLRQETLELADQWEALEETALVREEVLQQVIAELEALPDKYKTVLKLLFIEGKTYAEISALLNLPQATIRKQKERAVALLQSVLLKNQLSASWAFSPYFIFLLKIVTKG